MSDFLATILGVLLPICGSLIPIPLTVKKITGMINESKKNQIKLNDDLKEAIELTADHNKLESSLSYAVHKKGDSPQDKYKTTPPLPKPPKFDFNILYSSKLVTLKELHEKRNLDKSLKKISFILAVVMSITGTIILFIGILISLFTNKEIGWITTSSGAIIELVASIYFWLVNRTMKEVKDNSKQLEKTEDLFTAIELIEKISDISIKDETYKNVIDNLMNREK